MVGAAAFAMARPVYAGDAVTLDEVIAAHVAARGGVAALDRIKSCRITLDITEDGQTIQGDYAADVAGLVRIDVRVAGKLVYREGVDAQGAWLWPGDEPMPRASTAAGAAKALLNGAEGHLVGLHRFAARGHRVTLMAREAIAGVLYHVVEVAFASGHTSYFYIDPVSAMITRKRDARAYHPDVDPSVQRIETRFSDFRTVDGVVSADRNEDYDLTTGALLSVHQVTARAWNPDVPPGRFERTYVMDERR